MAPAGQTALQVGARSGHLEVVKELISRRANVSVRDDLGELESWQECFHGKG